MFGLGTIGKTCRPYFAVVVGKRGKVPKELRPENLNNQLQTSPLQTAFKETIYIVAQSTPS